MPCTITWEPKGVYSKFAGAVGIDDLFQMMRSVAADPRFDDIRYQITDFLDVSNQALTPEEIEEAAALDFAHSLSNPRFLHAAVAQDARVLALLRHWVSVSATPERIACFTTVEEARRWITANYGRARSLNTGFGGLD